MWIKEEMIAAFQEFNRKEGRWPKQEELRAKNNLPSYGSVRKKFGGLPLLVEAAYFRSFQGVQGSELSLP